MANKKSLAPLPLFDTLEHQKKEPPSSLPDFAYALDFLQSYNKNLPTYNAYRREIERFLQWCWRIKNQTVCTLNQVDIEEFIKFCMHPPLSWIGTKNVSRFIKASSKKNKKTTPAVLEDSTSATLRVPNPEWRPFVVNVSKAAWRTGERPNPKQFAASQASLKSIFAILSSFYDFLIQKKHTTTNPIHLMKQKNAYVYQQQTHSAIRRLSELQWTYVLETGELMAKENKKHERTLFIMTILYGMYLRISELTARATPQGVWTPKMGDFYQEEGLWWFRVLGKRNKIRDISVSDAVLKALKRYRRSLDLTVLPSSADPLPLITTYGGKEAITSTKQIRQIVQRCFDKTIERLKEDGFEEDADNLMQATVHWLRHTGISDDVKHRPREHVRDDAGHSSSAITDKYIDIEKRDRHASAKKKKLKG